MLIRAKLWCQLGGLDERYFFFFEETDFCLRARRAGFDVMHLPQVEVWHEQGKSAKQVPIPARVEYWRSRYLYFALNHPASTQRWLQIGLRTKLLANGIAANFLKCGGSEKWRQAAELNAALRRWHRESCPSEPGLPR
jgi:GT2 family glycosyltransferase